MNTLGPIAIVRWQERSRDRRAIDVAIADSARAMKAPIGTD